MHGKYRKNSMCKFSSLFENFFVKIFLDFLKTILMQIVWDPKTSILEFLAEFFFTNG